MEINLTISQKQKKFITAKADEVLFGGAAGGGKSYGQLIDALLVALEYPKSKQILFRRTFPELEKSVIRTALEIYPRGIYRYSQKDHSIRFINGSLLDFGYLDHENDVLKYQSAEYDVIRFDELTHFTEHMYVYMLSRCRGANNYPKQMKSSTNPGGVGHTWVKERFINIGAPGEQHVFAEGSRIFIPSLVFDNKFLLEKDPGYLKRLQNLSERDRKALLDGCWEITDGLFFSDVHRGEQIIPPFDIPPAWDHYFCMDYGLDMLAGYLIAVDYFGVCYVRREVYEGKDSGGDGLIVSEAAARIKEMIGDIKVQRYYAPPDLWNRQKDTGKSIAELFRDYGLPLTKAGNDREMGWIALKEMLKMNPMESGQSGSKLRIFTNCTNLVRCLTSIQVADNNPNDTANIPHELTHAPDALRYFAAARGVRETKKPMQKPIANFKSERTNYGFGKGEKRQLI